MTIKAIETKYKGYRFRSRLEARWAVFFDALGVRWEYEKEGYILDDGTHYLPDFWLPKWNCFAEVKGERFTRTEYNKSKGLPHPCLLLTGTPTVYGEYPITDKTSTYENYLSHKDFPVLVSYSAKKGRLWYLFDGDTAEDYKLDIGPEEKANGARFERGENG